MKPSSPSVSVTMNVACSVGGSAAMEVIECIAGRSVKLVADTSNIPRGDLPDRHLVSRTANLGKKCLLGGESDVVGEDFSIGVGDFVDFDVPQSLAGTFEESVWVRHGYAVKEA